MDYTLLVPDERREELKVNRAILSLAENELPSHLLLLYLKANGHKIQSRTNQD
jgi:hypothetical protein